MTARRFGAPEFNNVRRWLMTNTDNFSGMVTQWEKLIAEDYPAKRVMCMNSAMGALHVALQTVGVEPGDEVICDPMVAFGGLAAMYHNAVPVFADLDRRTFNVDPQSVAKLINHRTKAIICTHLMGNPCDVEALMALAKPRNIAVIEDCAHSLFARRNGTYAGLIGHFSAFSFNHRKHLSTGQGGALLINSDEYVAKSKFETYNRLPARITWNYAMPSIVAAIGLAQWPRSKEYVRKDHELAKLFDRACDGREWLTPQYVPPENYTSSLCWGALYEGDKKGIAYDEFMKVLKANGGDEFAASWMPEGAFGMPASPAYRYPLFSEPRAYGKGCPVRCPHYDGKVDYSEGACPVAEYIVPRLLNVGLTPGTEATILRSLDALTKTLAHFEGPRGKRTPAAPPPPPAPKGRFAAHAAVLREVVAPELGDMAKSVPVVGPLVSDALKSMLSR